jgi:hypothetical protein
MLITVVVTLCHALAGIPGPVCREGIVTDSRTSEVTMMSCMLSQPALAKWKSESIYRGDDWKISRITCVPGHYVIRSQV